MSCFVFALYLTIFDIKKYALESDKFENGTFVIEEKGCKRKKSLVEMIRKRKKRGICLSSYKNGLIKIIINIR